MIRFPWPRSLTGQMLTAVAVALLLAQTIGAILVYRAQTERRDSALIHAVAFRVLSAMGAEDRARTDRDRSDRVEPDRGRARPDHGPRGMRIEHSDISPIRPGELRDGEAENELRTFLADQLGASPGEVVVARRLVAHDPAAKARLARRAAFVGNDPAVHPHALMVVGIRQPGADRWMVTRTFVPPGDPGYVATLIGQTLLIYLLLVGTIALILRRITRPLAALTVRLEQFARDPASDGRLDPEGPDDVRRLIDAHNAMEARIAALLDEKDVMLGAIGHDLKTPLAGLRIRIESVENDAERARMAATIEDITRSLDDILSLARVGRPSDPLEQSELSALVASIIEEFEDMGEAVELGDMQRIALPLRATWLRRAVRNLVSNALRYGRRARVSVARDGAQAIVRIVDDGPGIPEADLERMLEPFTRGDPSRNSGTGGAGLGLTLARAIADQHGGELRLANRRGADGSIEGLTVTLRLPIT